MVKVDNSQDSCHVSVPDNLETDLVLLHGLYELMKIQYKNNQNGTWTIRSLDKMGHTIGDVSARGEQIGSTLRLVEDNQDDNQDNHLHLHHDIHDCNGSLKINLVNPTRNMMSSHMLFNTSGIPRCKVEEYDDPKNEWAPPPHLRYQVAIKKR